MERRAVLRAGIAGVTALAGCAGPDAPGGGSPTGPGTATGSGVDGSPGSGGLPPRLETITDRPSAPIALADAPDGPLYVADQSGRVLALGGDDPEIALDIGDAIEAGGERGLLGLALHPAFESNHRLYLRYSAPRREGTPPSYDHTFVLSEFRAAGDGTIDPGSERTLLEIPEPQSNHNSGSIVFGPDGLLYIGTGDGGGANDAGTGHVEDWYDATPGGNGQDVTENLLGSVLRIDVDSRTGDRPYGIPPDNPLVDGEGLPEHYAWGLRNPWGMSFDGDDLYVADVGQNRFEEVNLVVAGGNYGWNVKEATHCFGADRCPSVAPGGVPLVDPIVEYPHFDAPVSGFAVIGGYVYRGSRLPALRGRYVFGDLRAEGRLFLAVPPRGEGLWPTRELDLHSDDRGKLERLLAFGRDRDDELYVLARSGVHRLVPSE